MIVNGEHIPLSEMSPWELGLTIGLIALWLLMVGGFAYWGYRAFKAQLDVPKELASIRAALERIADRMDQKR